ncbi:MAG: TIM barrel protein [Nitrospiraceae bacterium]|nr:TIM barrel protein [Nitrospiraceae bacterium]
MDRRGFMASCATAAGGAVLLSATDAAAKPSSKKPFAKAPLKMSAPLDWFRGRTFEEKLDKVDKWGLPGCEWLGAKGDGAEFRKAADPRGIQLSCIGGVGKIAPGQMVLPSDHDKLVAQFEERVALAKAFGCKTLIGLTGNERNDATPEEQTKYILQCLERLAPIAESNDVVIVMEALNTLVNHKGYFLTRTDQTMAILEDLDSPNVKMCFDIYHQQITEGNVIRNLSENIDRIGHFHVADNPGRKEPGTGELNYTNIFKAIHKAGYKDFVALECGHSTKKYEDTLNATLACLDWS